MSATAQEYIIELCDTHVCSLMLGVALSLNVALLINGVLCKHAELKIEPEGER